MEPKELQEILEFDYYPMISETDIQQGDFTKIPFEEIGALGVTFASIPAIMKTSIQNMDAESIYRIVKMPAEAHLVDAKDGSGVLGMCFDKDNHLVGNAVFSPVDVVGKVGIAPIDPVLLFIAVMLIRIEHKLGVIQETQKEILSFIQKDKQTKIEGNLKTLVSIINDYKFNWDNETYKKSNHKHAGDIKREAQQNILFYRKSIRETVSEKKGVLLEAKVTDRTNRLNNDFKYYQLAVYMFGFASFLEVLLLENYKRTYIDNVIEAIEDALYEYKALYTEAYDRIERLSEDTIEARVMGGIKTASKSVGNAVAKVPIIEKSSLDETLISAGEKIESIGEKRIVNRLDLFDDNKDSGINIFIDHCNTLNEMFNQPKLVLLDNDNMYIRAEAS